MTELVRNAYGHYVARLGMKPGPMTMDYGTVVDEQQVTVVERDGALVGLLVVSATDEGFGIHNVAVHPAHQGHGLGHLLLRRAEDEAQNSGHESIYLYTHELMTENLALYQRVGYVEYDRRNQEGFSLVYLRKQLT